LRRRQKKGKREGERRESHRLDVRRKGNQDEVSKEIVLEKQDVARDGKDSGRQRKWGKSLTNN